MRIISLRWDQVDWDANLIWLEKKQTKAKQARVAPLYGALRAWFETASAARDSEVFYRFVEGQGISELKTA